MSVFTRGRRYYCDFPNGMHIYVFELRQIIPYAINYGTPVKVVRRRKGGCFTEPVFYDLEDGKLTRIPEGKDDQDGMETDRNTDL